MRTTELTLKKIDCLSVMALCRMSGNLKALARYEARYKEFDAELEEIRQSNALTEAIATINKLSE